MSSFATTLSLKIDSFLSLSIEMEEDCIFKFSADNGEKKLLNKELYKIYFSFICNTPIEVNNPIVTTGTHAAKDKGYSISLS